ncbi:MAG: hypothetical protein ACYTF6_09770, partial [Planctomycetota bacterium]
NRALQKLSAAYWPGRIVHCLPILSKSGLRTPVAESMPVSAKQCGRADLDLSFLAFCVGQRSLSSDGGDERTLPYRFRNIPFSTLHSQGRHGLIYSQFVSDVS